MGKEASLKDAIEDFRPTPLRQVIVWYHGTDNGSYVNQVGAADRIDHKNGDLEIVFKWIITVAADKQSKQWPWKAVAGSKRIGHDRVFSKPAVDFIHRDMTALRQGDASIEICIDGAHVIEAQRIFDRYTG